MNRGDVDRAARFDLAGYFQGLLFGLALSLWAMFVALFYLLNPTVSAMVVDAGSTLPRPLLRLGTTMLRAQYWAFFGAICGSILAVAYAAVYQLYALFVRRRLF